MRRRWAWRRYRARKAEVARLAREVLELRTELEQLQLLQVMVEESDPVSDSVGTVRRQPGGNLVHAIKLDGPWPGVAWFGVDAHGPTGGLSDADVASWPVVYHPLPDEVWEEQARGGAG